MCDWRSYAFSGCRAFFFDTSTDARFHRGRTHLCHSRLDSDSSMGIEVSTNQDTKAVIKGVTEKETTINQSRSTPP